LVNPANVDSTISPCQDFDAYVTGGGHKPQSTLVGATQSARPLLEDLIHRGVTVPEYLLQEAWHTAAVTSDAATRVLGDFYGSCMTDPTETTHGAVGDTTRANYCLTETKHELRGTLDEVYAQRVLTPAVRAQAAMVEQRLKLMMSQRIHAVPWLSERTKQQELAKLAAHTFRLGDASAERPWPDYTGFALSPTDFKGNLAAVAHAPDGAKSGSNFLPLYIPFAVRLINAALLVPPFFDSTDAAVAYGGLAFVMAHEMGHVFQNPGQGWTPSESEAFHQRNERLLMPYTFAGVTRIYKEQSENEHTADFIGLRLAYDAFEQVMQGKPRTRIDGLTPEQRFFVAFSSGMSYLYSVVFQGAAADLKSFGGQYWDDDHARAMALLRTNLAVSSFPAFAQAFGCKAGDPMVWLPNRPLDLW
jgi:putative endopeptidase